jgi:galactokinase
MVLEVTSRAYGRVNLIGEHTDYNGGWVLPTAIPQFTQITLSKGDEDLVHLISSRGREFSYTLGNEIPQKTWVDYLQGGTKILRERGIDLKGFNATINSSIPEGAGLSSSAALEMSFLKGLQKLFGFNISPLELAKIGQQIENEFVGANVGIMDQIASSLCNLGEALFLDTLSLKYERIPLPLVKMDLLVLNSGISHKLSQSGSGYNERRAQCEEAVRLLKVKNLREVTFDKLKESTLPETLLRRVRHVVTENKRVKDAVVAIKEENLRHLGDLLVASHISLRDDYQVSIPEIDLLVGLCLEHNEVYGARLTGGGFGGSVIALIKKNAGEKIASSVLSEYITKTGIKGKRIL